MVGLEYSAKTGLCRLRSKMDGRTLLAVDRVLSVHLQGVGWGYSYSGRRQAEAQPTGTFTNSQLKAKT